jgi:hypothetical protein
MIEVNANNSCITPQIIHMLIEKLRNIEFVRMPPAQQLMVLNLYETVEVQGEHEGTMPRDFPVTFGGFAVETDETIPSSEIHFMGGFVGRERVIGKITGLAVPQGFDK